MGRPLVAGQVDGVAIAIAERGQHIEAKITPLLEAGQATHARDSCMFDGVCKLHECLRSSSRMEDDQSCSSLKISAWSMILLAP